ncbi:MAG: hypothetical protein [Bacteriophage sp.]|nr:MAG: hypothetical protein [Bacteriophage sp.]
MAATKRQVWEAAKAADLADGISAITKAFPEAVQDVSVVTKAGTISTDDWESVEASRKRRGSVNHHYVNPYRERQQRIWEERWQAMQKNPLVTPP